jgi:hypothetical protein
MWNIIIVRRTVVEEPIPKKIVVRRHKKFGPQLKEKPQYKVISMKMFVTKGKLGSKAFSSFKKILKLKISIYRKPTQSIHTITSTVL